MPNQYHLDPGIVKACAGILESCRTEPYVTAIAQSEWVIGKNYALTEQAQANRLQLVKAVKLNLVNRRNYPFELLKEKYDFGLGYNAFGREKQRFCYELAQRVGLI